MHRNRIVSSGVALMLVASGAVLIGQSAQTGSVAGVVKDSSGKPISGARLKLIIGQGERVVISDAKGAYRFPQLTPGPGKLQISAEGFVGQSIELRVPLNSVLDVAAVLNPTDTVSATVVVTAGASLVTVDPSDAKTGQTRTLDIINILPINNRNPDTIARLSPGVYVDEQGNTSVRGAQGTQTLTLVDGADVHDPVTGGSGVRLNEEFIDEVQVISGGVSAEFGRFTGGVVNTVTKSGSNDFRATARFDVTNPNWNAYNPLNRGVRGNVTFADAHAVLQQYVVSGPIWKDHVFFAVGYRTTSPQISTPFTTTSPNFGGIGASATRSEERKDIKLDYYITPNHKVFWQYNDTVSQRTNIDYPRAFGFGSTTLASLSSQSDAFQYLTYGYQGTFGPNWVLNVRASAKKEILGGTAGPSGGQGGNAILWFDVNTRDVFDNGFFSNDGDSRPVDTLKADATWFATAGESTHEVKFGFDGLESRRNAANSQTPTNSLIVFNGFNNPNDSSIGNRILDINSPTTTYLEVYTPYFGRTTKTTVSSLYINDKWKLNRFWSFNLGLRYDSYKSKDDIGRENFNFQDVSPRLAALWDLRGDGAWVLQANFAKYNGAVPNGQTDGSSSVGNPGTYDYVYLGGDPLLRSSFSSTPFSSTDSYLLNSTRIDPNVKAPQVLEYSVGIKRSNGKGLNWSITADVRKFSRFIDDYIQARNGIAYTVYQNDDSIERDYFGIEGVLDHKINENWNWGVSITLSSLRGNYEGGQVGNSDPRNNFPSDRISNQRLAPYGFLQGDTPLNLNTFANYNKQLGYGRIILGALGYFQSGGPYSLTTVRNPLPPDLVADGYGSNYTRYYSDRGALRFPDTYRLDVQAQYIFPIYRGLEAFLRVNIGNVFNHQLLQSFNTTGNYSAASPNTWVAGPSFGRPTSSTNYIAARNINIAGGFRF